MNKRDLVLMDDIMSCLDQTSEWINLQRTDSQITKADKDLERCLDRLRTDDPEYAESLYSAMWDVVDAYADAAILYGLHVADVIRTVPAMPGALSQHILDRLAADREEVEA